MLTIANGSWSQQQIEEMLWLCGSLAHRQTQIIVLGMRGGTTYMAL